jgi:molybdopterin converting factor small subunit
VVVGIPPLRLQPDAEQIDAPRYLLDELLRYHDRTFVAHVYTALAKREPTNAELANAVDDLRSGRRGKVEIIEEVLAARANGKQRVQVEGLPSPALRRLSRWPVIGYILRLLHGLARLPVLMRDQQQFETYTMGQQQLIADYLNELLLPAIDQPAAATHDSRQAGTIADAIEGVMMLSDSLVDISARQVEFQAQLQELQKQREESELQLHADLMRLTEAFTAQQQQLGELRHENDVTAAAQREFLVQEQRLIVETQKVALGDMQEQLRALILEQEGKQAEFAAEVRRLRTQIESLRAGAREPLVAQEREQA